MNSNLIFFILLLLFVVGCSSKEITTPNVTNDTIGKVITQTDHLANAGHVAYNWNIRMHIEDYPELMDTCKCSFNTIGEIRTNKTRYDIIISGKGWNPEYYSCSWTWGELISNIFPPDSLTTDFRIHLLDMENLEKNLPKEFLDSKQFKDNLIASYYRLPNEEYYSCKFDPNNTRKYPKPKQWAE